MITAEELNNHFSEKKPLWVLLDIRSWSGTPMSIMDLMRKHNLIALPDDNEINRHKEMMTAVEELL